MADFYAEIEGNRSLKTCIGTKSSGIDGHIRGWSLGGAVEMCYCEIIEDDVVYMRITGGSNGNQDSKYLPTMTRDRKGKLTEYEPYRNKIQKAKDEFNQLHSDDIAFRRQYKKKEFWEWYEDQGNL